MSTLEDRLLRNPIVMLILDLVTVLVDIYLWLSLSMKAMTREIGLTLISITVFFYLVALATGYWGLLAFPFTTTLLGFLVLHHTARREGR